MSGGTFLKHALVRFEGSSGRQVDVRRFVNFILKGGMPTKRKFEEDTSSSEEDSREILSIDVRLGFQ